MQRADKLDFVKDLNSVLKKTDFLMVAHYQGLTVSEISNLRGQIKTANSKFKVTKNTLTKRALKDTNFEVLEKLFVGPTSLAYSDDPVSTVSWLISKDNRT